jgi:hypothetical protein
MRWSDFTLVASFSFARVHAHKTSLWIARLNGSALLIKAIVSVFIGPWALQGQAEGTGCLHVQTEQAVHQLTSSFNKTVVVHEGATCFHLPDE